MFGVLIFQGNTLNVMHAMHVFKAQSIWPVARTGCVLILIDFVYIVVPRVICASNKHLTTHLQNIIEDGGEGVIVRQRRSFYVPGRSPLLIKLKDVQGDKEALVIGIKPNSVRLKLYVTFLAQKNCLPQLGNN